MIGILEVRLPGVHVAEEAGREVGHQEIQDYEEIREAAGRGIEIGTEGIHLKKVLIKIPTKGKQLLYCRGVTFLMQFLMFALIFKVM